jgi:hypothetical protein
MQWKYYWQNMVKRHHVIIEGWPENIPFHNLSEAATSLSDLENLLWKWCSETMYWKDICDDNLDALDHEHDAQIESGE